MELLGFCEFVHDVRLDHEADLRVRPVERPAARAIMLAGGGGDNEKEAILGYRITWRGLRMSREKG